MTLENDLNRALSSSRPAPGPGFEARMRAGVLGHAVKGTRVRFGTALAVASVGVAVAAVVAFLVTRDQPEPIQTRAADEPANKFSPAPVAPAPAEEAARKPAPAGVTLDRGVAERMMEESPTIEDVDRAVTLSPRGRDTVVAALDSARKADIKLRARADVMFVDLERELAAAVVNEAAIAKLVEGISRVEGERRVVRMRAWLVLRRVLPEQAFETLLDNRADRRARKPTPKRGRSTTKGAGGKKATPCDEVACLVDPTLGCCARGKLQIAAVPWATVIVDGRTVGTTPVSLNLPPGRHLVNLRAKGFSTERFRVTIKSNSTTRVSKKLKKLRESPPLNRDFR